MPKASLRDNLQSQSTLSFLIVIEDCDYDCDWLGYLSDPDLIAFGTRAG
jgi:hypothetical protein